MRGWARRWCSSCWTAAWSRSVADLYSLNEEQLISLDRFAEKSARALLEEIERSKKAGLARVLMGLGIRFVGERTAELLAEEFGSIDTLRAATAEELERVEEVGPRISQAILRVFCAAGKPGPRRYSPAPTG